MALFGGKGVPTSLLVVVSAWWLYEVFSLHAPQILSGYEGDTYTVAHGVIVQRNNPRWWMTAHAASGAVVFIMWTLQVTQEVRQWSYTFHRWNGRLSLLMFLPAGIFIPYRAFFMSQTEKEMEWISRAIIGFFGLTVLAWIAVGWVAIAQWKDVGLHRQCMVRVLLGSTMFILGSRSTIYLYRNFVRTESAWYLDETTWFNAALSGVFIEMMSYLMEKSFEKPWEYRVLGFVKIWDAPEEEKAVQMAPAEEQS